MSRNRWQNVKNGTSTVSTTMKDFIRVSAEVQLHGECTELRLEPVSQEMVMNVAANHILERDKELRFDSII